MQKIIARDLSWLSFNKRVLQEAADSSVPLNERLKFLGIFSNNLDEFFRVRVATLKRMIELKEKGNMDLEIRPDKTLEEIQHQVLDIQSEFEFTWRDISREMKKNKIFLIDEKKLNTYQKKFVSQYFDDEVRSHIVPLMLESIPEFPSLNDKSLYLACTLKKNDAGIPKTYALISVPTRFLPRFIILPSREKEKHLILLEDIIRFCLPKIFSFFGYDHFSAHAIKITRDAEIDIDNDVSTSLIQKIEKGLKNRKKGKPVRFVFDKEIPEDILNLLTRKLSLTHKDNLIAGGRIHNFKDFMNFPSSVFNNIKTRKKPFTHPELKEVKSVSEIILKKDVMVHLPYHSFDSIIDLLREAAIDPGVFSIKITFYRLASRSKIINAIINAVRNGKKVTVVIELRARFDEEANLSWKKELEEAGVKVIIGMPRMKIHAKMCVIKKKIGSKIIHYGFISTGNLNEKTATTYGDHCLMTSDKSIMNDVNKVFNFLENPYSEKDILKTCQTLLISPRNMRQQLTNLIEKEIKNVTNKKTGFIILKINSLSDVELIEKLHEAARYGVEIKLIVRGICCMLTENKKFKKDIKSISIIDEYLEHSRVMIFHNNGDEKIYISSADWMRRNIDHRIEVACPILNPSLKKEIREMLDIQLSDNVKARIISNEQQNNYVNPRNTKKIRSQVEIYNYLFRKCSGSVR